MSHRPLVIVLPLLVIGLAGCGGDGPSDVDPSAPNSASNSTADPGGSVSAPNPSPNGGGSTPNVVATNGGSPNPKAERSGAGSSVPGPGSCDCHSVFADLPEDSRPRDDQDTVRLDRANRWLKDRDLTEKTLRFTLPKVSPISVKQPTGYRVTLIHRAVKCDVHGVEFPLNIGIPSGLAFADVDEETADRLYDFKDRDIEVVGTANELFFNGRMLTLTFATIYVEGVDLTKYIEKPRRPGNLPFGQD